MKTSLNELALIDRYIDGEMHAVEKILFEARQQEDHNLRASVRLQQRTRRLVVAHGRSKLHSTLDRLHRKYFEEPDHFIFRETIFSCFR